jgi:hypothetical protein
MLIPEKKKRRSQRSVTNRVVERTKTPEMTRRHHPLELNASPKTKPMKPKALSKEELRQRNHEYIKMRKRAEEGVVEKRIGTGFWWAGGILQLAATTAVGCKTVVTNPVMWGVGSVLLGIGGALWWYFAN